MILTCIGSRSTPTSILNQMTEIGKLCRENKHWVRSGHADGADWAFEQGAQEYCLVYLPWHGFNKQLVSKAKVSVPPFPPSDKALALVKQFHPSPDKLNNGAMRLMVRNGYQVLGVLLEKPSDFVVAYTSDGKFSGGTGQALRIAEYHKIPIYNLYFKDAYNQVVERIKSGV